MPKAARNTSTAHQDQMNLPQFAVLTDRTGTTYPEIRYIFKDDPLYDTLEPVEGEETMVVELDSQGRLVSGKSLSEEIGIIGVAMRDREDMKTLCIDVIRNDHKIKDVGPGKDMNALNALINEFNRRNEELQKVIQND